MLLLICLKKLHWIAIIYYNEFVTRGQHKHIQILQLQDKDRITVHPK